MSNDFLTEEELAELEAELGDLAIEETLADEDEGASEKALEKALEKAPEPEEVTQAAADEPVDDDFDTEALEAELNATEAEPEKAESDSDVEARIQAAKKAEHEAQQAQLKEEMERLKAEALAEPELEQPKTVTELPTQNTTEATYTADSSDDELMDMVLNSGSSFDPRRLQGDLSFSENNLDDAFMSQAGMFAHYSGIAHRAARRHDQLVQQEKLVQAKLDQEYRQQAADDGEKVTEAVIKNRILLDPRHRKIMERVLDAKAVAAMTKDACDAFKQRRDMLIQMGANVREEHKGEMRMKAVRESQDDMQRRALERLNQG